ncbi:hypothetical protein TNCV_1621251 [Trichonephila clavipes]|nr:hypothetical protein TNCV_1621251 [Trichonephila clavipes]
MLFPETQGLQGPISPEVTIVMTRTGAYRALAAYSMGLRRRRSNHVPVLTTHHANSPCNGLWNIDIGPKTNRKKSLVNVFLLKSLPHCPVYLKMWERTKCVCVTRTLHDKYNLLLFNCTSQQQSKLQKEALGVI